MRDRAAARELADALLATGRRAGKEISALVTDMGQPLGEAIGHALEVQEAIDGLRGGGPSDQRELTVELVAEMGRLAGLGSREALVDRVCRHLDDGSGLERLQRMVEAHGGRLDADDPSAGLEIAPEVEPFVADRTGVIGDMDAAAIGLAVVDLGGGRRRHDDEIDLSVGLRMVRKRGHAVEVGDVICRVHARDDQRAEAARQRLRGAVRVVEGPVEKLPLVLERVV
jgi:thymidine phosphorylase